MDRPRSDDNLVAGCGKKPQPVTTPPPPVSSTPPPEVEPMPEAAPSDAVEQPPPLSAQEIEEDARRQGLLGDVFYDFDQYDLRPDARERLARNAEFMNDEQGYTFTIEGHCDERGTNEYNIALGHRRANAALEYLSSLGVTRNRFKTLSFGEERPFCTQSNEECWQLNRRARFVLTGTGG
jgi:peptidoglycan-associated lipoprotein